MRKLLKENLLPFYMCLHIALWVMIPIYGNKTATLHPFVFLSSLPALILVYILVDVVTQNYGKTEARIMVTIALIIRFLILGFHYLSMALPTLKEPQGYSLILTTAIWLFIAGELSAFISQIILDINIFAWLKQKMKGKFYGLRYNLTSVPSIMAVYLVFFPIAFWGKPLPFITNLIIGQTTIHLIFAFLATPIAVLLNNFTKNIIKN